MKTYKDLTDDELKQLHRDILGVPNSLPHDLAVKVDRSHENDKLSPNIETIFRRGYKDEPRFLITWWIEDGSFQMGRINDQEEEFDGGTSFNPFTMVKLLKALGLDY